MPEINDTVAKRIVVIPAYNESSVLTSVVNSLLEKGYCIVIVDDGSDPPLSFFIQNMPVFFLRHRANLGQGAALQTGFDFAKKLNPELVISFDADGQHDASCLPALIEPLLNNKADVVLGSRFLSAEKTIMPFSKKILLQTARGINYLFSGLLLSDAHNGLRAFNRVALDKINITENRMAHASEIIFEIKKHGLRFKEIPVRITYTAYSKKKGQSGWDSIKILFDLILHKLFK
jgi:glycosyltransferase involved in cell wall biosynthesis